MQIFMPATVRRAASCVNSFQPAPIGETILLQDRQLMKLRKAAGWHVKALTGSLWITQDGDVRDIVLTAGDSVLLDRNASALISSFSTASFRLYRDTGDDRHPHLPIGAKPPASIPASAPFA